MSVVNKLQLGLPSLLLITVNCMSEEAAGIVSPFNNNGTLPSHGRDQGANSHAHNTVICRPNQLWNVAGYCSCKFGYVTIVLKQLIMQSA
jgi:hypothetical protein